MCPWNEERSLGGGWNGLNEPLGIHFIIVGAPESVSEWRMSKGLPVVGGGLFQSQSLDRVFWFTGWL